MREYNLLAFNMDYCPKKDDAIIYQHLCGGCPHYHGVEVVNGLPCTKCSYYYDESPKE